MESEEIFKNLTPEEFEKAQKWYDHLHQPERGRIFGTLAVLSSSRFNLHGKKDFYGDGITVIVAGTSIDTDAYQDIDLFVLTEPSLENTLKDNSYRTAPHTSFLRHLEDRLPKHVYVIQYPNIPIKPEELDKEVYGAEVTVSLFYDLEGFKEERPDKNDDLIEPFNPQRDSEGIISYNQEKGAKFLVLSRQDYY